jgi:hypothetical protein
MHRETPKSDLFTKDTDALPVLRELLDDNDEHICNIAFESFLTQENATQDDVASLVEFLMKDRLSPVRRAWCAEVVIVLLCDKLDARALGACEKWLAHENPKHVALAALGLAGCKQQQMGLLVNRLEQADAGRLEVIFLLGEIGMDATPALPKLREIARSDEVPQTRAKAKQAIAKITSAN